MQKFVPNSNMMKRWESRAPMLSLVVAVAVCLIAKAQEDLEPVAVVGRVGQNSDINGEYKQVGTVDGLPSYKKNASGEGLKDLYLFAVTSEAGRVWSITEALSDVTEARAFITDDADDLMRTSSSAVWHVFEQDAYGVLNPVPDPAVYVTSVSCSNGARDELEEGIDCGGPCRPCEYMKGCYIRKRPASFTFGDCPKDGRLKHGESCTFKCPVSYVADDDPSMSCYDGVLTPSGDVTLCKSVFAQAICPSVVWKSETPSVCDGVYIAYQAAKGGGGPDAPSSLLWFSENDNGEQRFLYWEQGIWRCTDPDLTTYLGTALDPEPVQRFLTSFENNLSGLTLDENQQPTETNVQIYCGNANGLKCKYLRTFDMDPVGDVRLNGLWKPTEAEVNGKPAYKLQSRLSETDIYLHWSPRGYWMIDGDMHGEEAIAYQFSLQDTPTTGSWRVWEKDSWNTRDVTMWCLTQQGRLVNSQARPYKQVSVTDTDDGDDGAVTASQLLARVVAYGNTNLESLEKLPPVGHWSRSDINGIYNGRLEARPKVFFHRPDTLNDFHQLDACSHLRTMGAPTYKCNGVWTRGPPKSRLPAIEAVRRDNNNGPSNKQDEAYWYRLLKDGEQMFLIRSNGLWMCTDNDSTSVYGYLPMDDDDDVIGDSVGDIYGGPSSWATEDGFMERNSFQISCDSDLTLREVFGDVTCNYVQVSGWSGDEMYRFNGVYRVVDEAANNDYDMSYQFAKKVPLTSTTLDGYALISYLKDHGMWTLRVGDSIKDLMRSEGDEDGYVAFNLATESSLLGRNKDWVYFDERTPTLDVLSVNCVPSPGFRKPDPNDDDTDEAEQGAVPTATAYEPVDIVLDGTETVEEDTGENESRRQLQRIPEAITVDTSVGRLKLAEFLKKIYSQNPSGSLNSVSRLKPIIDSAGHHSTKLSPIDETPPMLPSDSPPGMPAPGPPAVPAPAPMPTPSPSPAAAAPAPIPTPSPSPAVLETPPMPTPGLSPAAQASNNRPTADLPPFPVDDPSRIPAASDYGVTTGSALFAADGEGTTGDSNNRPPSDDPSATNIMLGAPPPSISTQQGGSPTSSDGRPPSMNNSQDEEQGDVILGAPGPYDGSNVGFDESEFIDECRYLVLVGNSINGYFEKGGDIDSRPSFRSDELAVYHTKSGLWVLDTDVDPDRWRAFAFDNSDLPPNGIWREWNADKSMWLDHELRFFCYDSLQPGLEPASFVNEGGASTIINDGDDVGNGEYDDATTNENDDDNNDEEEAPSGYEEAILDSTFVEPVIDDSEAVGPITLSGGDAPPTIVLGSVASEGGGLLPNDDGRQDDDDDGASEEVADDDESQMLPVMDANADQFNDDVIPISSTFTVDDDDDETMDQSQTESDIDMVDNVVGDDNDQMEAEVGPGTTDEATTEPFMNDDETDVVSDDVDLTILDPSVLQERLESMATFPDADNISSTISVVSDGDTRIKGLYSFQIMDDATNRPIYKKVDFTKFNKERKEMSILFLPRIGSWAVIEYPSRNENDDDDEDATINDDDETHSGTIPDMSLGMILAYAQSLAMQPIDIDNHWRLWDGEFSLQDPTVDIKELGKSDLIEAIDDFARAHNKKVASDSGGEPIEVGGGGDDADDETPSGEIIEGMNNTADDELMGSDAPLDDTLDEEAGEKSDDEGTTTTTQKNKK